MSKIGQTDEWGCQSCNVTLKILKIKVNNVDIEDTEKIREAVEKVLKKRIPTAILS